MEESFEIRVKRLFGSKLFESVPDSSFPATSWSVAEGEVERREWNRERGGGPDREDIPCSSAFSDKDGCFSKKQERSRDPKKQFEDDTDDLDDGEEGGEGGGGEDDEGGSDVEREEREIRSFVGLDPTLDHEDEEDEFDRAALCREDAGERVYMRDVKDHGPYLNCRAVVPDLFEDSFEETHQSRRDLRADHFAASLRLREDKRASESCPPLPSHTDEEPSGDFRAKKNEHDVNLKPILKRKECQIDSKPKKRVRFDTGCREGRDEIFEEPQDFQTVPRQEESPGVPDYMRNPSKYTRYTFDLSEENEDETSKHAFEDFQNLVKASNTEQLQPELSVDLPVTVTFTSRKKAGDAMPVDDAPGFVQGDSCKETGQGLICSAGVAEGEARDSGSCEMEEDGAESPVAGTGVSARKDRRYRAKSTPEDST